MTLARRTFLAGLTMGGLVRPVRADRPPVGQVSTVTGAAQALFSSEPPRPLAPPAPVLLDDLLTTGPGARLACMLEGGMDLRLGENAALRVDALLLRGPGARVALRGFGGALLFDRPPEAPRVPTTVTMPWARMAVRGTRFFAGPLDGGFAVFVAHGRVLVEAGGGRAELAEGDGVDIAAPGAPPTNLRAWGAARIARALASVQ